jgi:hypothetical protein
VTEAEWLACTDPQTMLEFLRGKASDRKLRLFACHCCYHSLQDHGCFKEEAEDAVVMAEWFADGEATLGDLIDEREDFMRSFDAATFTLVAMMDAVAPTMATPMTIDDALRGVVAIAEYNRVIGFTANEQAHQCEVLRDFFGNPFRRLHVINPPWLAWNDGTVPKLAQGIYEQRRFEGMFVLADALEDAGCTDAGLLAHLRGPGPHVRGCWAVDLILGKS